MWDQSKLNPFNFLIFVSLIHWIRGELTGLKEEMTRTNSEKNDSTTAITVPTTDNKILGRKFKSHELSVKEMKAAEAENNFFRRTRDADLDLQRSDNVEIATVSLKAKITFSSSTLDCYYCSASRTSTIDDPCYKGGR